MAENFVVVSHILMASPDVVENLAGGEDDAMMSNSFVRLDLGFWVCAMKAVSARTTSTH